MLYAISSPLLRKWLFKEKIKWSLVKTKCRVIWPLVEETLQSSKDLRPFLMGEHYLFSHTGKSRKHSVWRCFAPDPQSSSREINSMISPILKNVFRTDTQTFFFQCKFDKRFMFRFAFQLSVSLGLLCWRASDSLSSADSGICTQVSLTSQQSQASAIRSPSLQQVSVSSLLLSHSSKCSENFSIKWFPCSPRNSENLCRKWQKKLLYLQKFTKEASSSNRKKTDTWFAKSGNWWLIKDWWLLIF